MRSILCQQQRTPIQNGEDAEQFMLATLYSHLEWGGCGAIYVSNRALPFIMGRMRSSLFQQQRTPIHNGDDAEKFILLIGAPIKNGEYAEQFILVIGTPIQNWEDAELFILVTLTANSHLEWGGCGAIHIYMQHFVTYAYQLKSNA